MKSTNKLAALIAQFCGSLSIHDITPPYGYENLADYLISNGTTVQEWISVKDQLPKEDERVLVWVGNNRYNNIRKDTDRVHNGNWVRWGDCVTYWAPWNIPQPPKGD